jgi:acyl-coenzyme A synthetase/AMP-(fatty) acid ligase
MPKRSTGHLSVLPSQANWLKSQGIKKGDTVAVYMPMVGGAQAA